MPPGLPKFLRKAATEDDCKTVLATAEPFTASRCRDAYRNKVRAVVDRNDDPGSGKVVTEDGSPALDSMRTC